MKYQIQVATSSIQNEPFPRIVIKNLEINKTFPKKKMFSSYGKPKLWISFEFFKFILNLERGDWIFLENGMLDLRCDI